MKRKKRRERITIAVMVLIILLLFGVGLYFVVPKIMEKPKNENTVPPRLTTVQTPQDAEKAVEQVKQSKYVKETCYNGKVMDSSLYETPFKRTGNYISNMDLLQKYGTDFLTEKEDMACKYVKMLYNVNCNYLISDPNKYIKTFKDYYGDKVFFDDGDAEYSIDNYAEQLVDKYVTNNAQIEAEFITDKSLVFYDNGYTYVRGYLKYTVFSYTDMDSLREELRNKDLQLGTTYYIMTHVILRNSLNEKDKYEIVGLEL